MARPWPLKYTSTEVVLKGDRGVGFDLCPREIAAVPVNCSSSMALSSIQHVDLLELFIQPWTYLRTSRGSADRFPQISSALITVKSGRSSISHKGSVRDARNLIQTILEASIQKFRYFSLLGEGYLTTFTLLSRPYGVPKWSVVFCGPCMVLNLRLHSVKRYSDIVCLVFTGYWV